MKMPNDFFDQFLKQQNNRFFTEVTNLVRQNIWRETYDVVESQEWEEITAKIRKD